MTTHDIDLDAYFRRIGFRAAPRPDLATLNVALEGWENTRALLGG